MADCDDCCGPKDLTHTTAAYRRALWIVVILNAGYGVVEMFGGYFAGSQALKADALDFLGDGSITLLGLLALSWESAWRSRAAFLQGLFLAALGVGVFAAAAYRVFVVNEPEAFLMSGFGIVALIVNMAAAWVLSKHREGDANVRAVWLFSRNDAVGNVAVIIAAGLVWLTATPWPDLAVAVVIAGLFLHSAVDIIRDSLREMNAAQPAAAE